MTPQELRARRAALGLSQAALAAALGGVSANAVARWERGAREFPPYLELAIEAIEQKAVAAG